MKVKDLIDKLYLNNNLTYDELLFVIKNIDKENANYLFDKAFDTRKKHYDNKVYLRGLIEISNYCKNDCYYCGIRCSNKNITRFRLNKEDILRCCEIGYKVGYRTFVLQGGEDNFYTTDVMCDIISSIKDLYPDCAITLSLGEKNYDTYKRYYSSGADRYLLRHETATTTHYNKLHPKNMSLDYRKKCLTDMKDIGFQIGAGFMVGSPFQEDTHLASDLIYLKELNPHMVGLGPFIPHHDTKFKDYPHGNLEKTLIMLSLTRLLLPKALLPATTALASIDLTGRNRGLSVGCNVIMPNLSPEKLRGHYSLYDNKLSSGQEAFEYHKSLEENIKSQGLEVDYSRGDNIEWRRL